MDLSQLKDLPIPIASLGVLAIFAWVVIDRLSKIIDATLRMFESHKEALTKVTDSMAANTQATIEQVRNTQESTAIIRELSVLIRSKNN